jgi:hypothetical protein
MKQLILISAIFLIYSSNVFSQVNCNIIENYGEFIKVEKINDEGNEFLDEQIVEPDSQKCFWQVVKNQLYIDYLLKNFSSEKHLNNLLNITDTLTLQNEYIKFLKEDSLFNQVMTDLVAKTIEKRLAKDTITMDKLLDFAVKFFSIIELNEDGYYVGKLCVGLNLISKTEKLRLPHVEAFCFSSIAKNYQSDEFNMYEEFVKAMEELYKINLGIEKNEKLLRAQGAMFFLMRNNDNLRTMLKIEYERNAENLPFILK